MPSLQQQDSHRKMRRLLPCEDLLARLALTEVTQLEGELYPSDGTNPFLRVLLLLPLLPPLPLPLFAGPRCWLRDGRGHPSSRANLISSATTAHPGQQMHPSIPAGPSAVATSSPFTHPPDISHGLGASS